MGYSSGFNGFARGDFGGVDHAIAGDLQRSDFFVARYSFRRDLAVFENTDQLDELARGDLGELDGFVAGDLQAAGFLFGADAVCRDLLVEGDARGLGRLAGVDFGDLDSLDPRDLPALCLLLGDDAFDRDLPFLGDARRLDRLARRDLGFVDRARSCDFQGSDALLLLDARRGHQFARRDVAFLQRPRAFDFERPGGELGGDTLGGKRLFAGDAGGFGDFRGGDLFLVDRAIAPDLTAADFLFEGDALVGDDALLRDPCALGRLAGRDLGLLQVASALDFEAPVLLFLGDARRGDRDLLRDTRFLGFFAGNDFGLLDVARAFDLTPLVVLLARDPRLGENSLLGDAGALDPFTRGDFRLVDLARPIDLALADVALGGDAGLGERALVGDAGLLDLLAAGDLGLFRLGVAQRTLASEFGALYRASDLDVAFLIEPRGLALAIDIQRLLLGLEIAGANEDHRILLDVVAQLAPRFDVLNQLGQTFGVEAVRRIEEFEVGLIEIGDRHRFQFKAVLLEALQRRIFDPGDVFATPLVHLHHRHLGSDRTQRGDQFAGQQRVKLGNVHGAPAQRRGGDGDRLPGWRHPHVEFGFDVDAHAILRDERVFTVANDLHAQDVHVDRGDLVNEREYEGSGVDHHLFAEQAGAHEGDFLR